MKRGSLFILGIGCGLIIPAVALAESAYTTKTVNMRAGPSREYEVVTQVGGGTPVEVGGCVDDWTWCDVIAGPDRGWVYAGNLEYPYQGRRVVILTNGPAIGLVIEPFVLGTYWDTYYRGRPWYGRRSYWVGRPAPSRVVVRSGAPRPAVRPSSPRPSSSHTAPKARPESRSHAPAPKAAPKPAPHKPEEKKKT
jgi:uncharacterized protein YraI